MKHIIKKITASLAAAVMCAAPMASSLSANASVSSNARYTFRQVYWADYSANVKRFEFSFAVRKYHDSVPFYNLIGNQATVAGGGSAGDTYYSCGGTVTANTRLSGPFLSVSAYSENPADYADSFGTCRAYRANGQQAYNAVNYSVNRNYDYDWAAFLVGDFNNDLKVDGADYSYLDAVVNSSMSNYGYSWSVYVLDRTLYMYQFDINDDGVINSDDLDMFRAYDESRLTKFPK